MSLYFLELLHILHFFNESNDVQAAIEMNNSIVGEQEILATKFTEFNGVLLQTELTQPEAIRAH